MEIGSKPQDAIPYCHKAISVCKSRVQRLSDELKNSPSMGTSGSSDFVANKEEEIETLNGLASELERKKDSYNLI